MTNYFSVGLCAQTGHQMEKKRTSVRCCNDVKYVTEGLKLLCRCTRNMRPLKEVLEGVYTVREGIQTFSSDEIEEEKEGPQCSRVLVSCDDGVPSPYYLQGNPISLFACNIQSFMGGRYHSWRSTKGRVGVLDRSRRPVRRDFFEEECSFSDSILELISF